MHNQSKNVPTQQICQMLQYSCTLTCPSVQFVSPLNYTLQGKLLLKRIRYTVSSHIALNNVKIKFQVRQKKEKGLRKRD